MNLFMETKKVPAHVEEIHLKAVRLVGEYRRAEIELIEILQEVDREKVYAYKGYSSLFMYAKDALGLSENVIYSLITVARKAVEVPELKEKIASGEMTLTNAKRISAVLNQENKSEWIEKASELSYRQLEREVAKVRPEEKTPERVSYVSESHLKMQIGLTEEQVLMLRNAQELLCQSTGQALSLSDTVALLTEEFLKRKDPVQKATRVFVKKGFIAKPKEQSQTKSDDSLVARRGDRADASKLKRTTPPAHIVHQLNLRDQRRCAYVRSDGSRCGETRWIQVHHLKEVSQGGTHALENLTTLCSTHHKLVHGTLGGTKAVAAQRY